MAERQKGLIATEQYGSENSSTPPVVVKKPMKLKIDGRQEWKRITELHSGIISAGFSPTS